MIVPLARACQDRRLLGATITWRPRQLEVLEAFGDDALRLVAVCAGRQGGKSSMAVGCGIWGATMRDDLDALMPRGQVRHVLLAAPSEDQSRSLVRMGAAMVEASPVLRDLATVTADRIDFRLPSGARTALVALPASARTVRGLTASLTVVDEAAFLASETLGPANDARLIEALQGSMSVFDAVGKSKLILISTPAGRSGRFFELYEAAESGLLPASRAIRATAWELNPALDSDEWRDGKRALLGEDGFLREHAAEWTVGGDQFVDMRGVELLPGPLPPEASRDWCAAVDVAFHGDRTAVVLVGEAVEDRGRLVLGAVEAIEPRRKRRGRLIESAEARRQREDATLAKVAAIVEPYRPARVVADSHEGDSLRSFFGRLGYAVQIEHLSGQARTQAFTSMRARVYDGSLLLWDHPLLIEELRRIKVRGDGGIVLARFGGGHSDCAAALALGCWVLRGRRGAPAGEVRAGGTPLSAGLRGPGEVGSHVRSDRPDPDGFGNQSPTPPTDWPGESILHMRF